MKNQTFKNFIWIVGAILFCILFISLWAFYSAIRPYKLTAQISPADFKIPYEKVTFRTPDNFLIRGWFIPSNNPKAKTIILLHGYPISKNILLPTRIFLHQKYHLLFFDFRYFGESEGHYTTVGKKEVTDLLTAIQFLKNRGINEVGVWGLSLGGAVALLTAPHTNAIKAMVIEASYADLKTMVLEYYLKIPLLRYPLASLLRFWGKLFLNLDIQDVNPSQAASKLTMPIMLIQSKDDKIVPFEQSQLLIESLRNNPHVTVITWENLRHGQLPKGYQKLILNFFNKYL